MPLFLRAKNLISYYEVSRCRDVSVGGGSNCGGHPYISFLFRMNFFISCTQRNHVGWDPPPPFSGSSPVATTIGLVPKCTIGNATIVTTVS